MEYYERLRYMREDSDLLQKDIAEILNCYQQQYASWESGKVKMPIDKFKALCKYYNISADYLLGLTDEPSPLKKKKQ